MMATRNEVFNAPFPDGVLTLYDAAEWRVIPARHRGSNVTWRARTALAQVFDDAWLREQTRTSHPLSSLWPWRHGRWKILRLGIALSVLSASAGARDRLRHPDHFIACAAELDFGLSLWLSGAQVRHEPCHPGTGPDFIATWGSKTMAFEVKCPETSKRMRELGRVAVQVSFGLSGAVGVAHHLPGYFLEVVIAEARLASAAACRDDEQDLLQLVKRGAYAWVQAPGSGTIIVSKDVRFEARRREERGVYTSGPGFCGDEPYESRRLVRNLTLDAVRQLSAAKMPGFLVLAKERDALIGNHLHGLSQEVRRDRRFANITGLIEYDVEPDAALCRPVANARILVRAEARGLARSLSRLPRAARTTISYF